MNYKKISYSIKNYFCRTNRKDGFTIIELVVVVAIIAILASIITTGTVLYIKKAKDRTIMGDMNSMMTASNIYWEKNSTYLGLCEDDTSGFITAYNAATRQSNEASSCNISLDGTQWSAYVFLNNGNGNSGASAYWCVDSTGNKKEEVYNFYPAYGTFYCP